MAHTDRSPRPPAHQRPRKSPLRDVQLDEITDSVVRVGDGRGFFVKTLTHEHWVVTAAHCLPHLPPAHSFAYTQDRTYADLLGALDEPPHLWCACPFADPIADLAVLHEPDGQALIDEWDQYTTFAEARPSLQIAPLTRAAAVFLLSRGGKWEESRVESGSARCLTLVDAHVVGGMSGSPIIDQRRRAVGLVSVGTLLNGVESRTQYGQRLSSTPCRCGSLRNSY